MSYDVYESALHALAERARQAAQEAERAGDEREKSLQLMRASMLGNMLIALGKVDLDGRHVGVLADIRAQCERNEQKLRALGDEDAADRERVKAETIAIAEEALIKAKGGKRA